MGCDFSTLASCPLKRPASASPIVNPKGRVFSSLSPIDLSVLNMESGL